MHEKGRQRIRKKTIFPAVCDYLRSHNPYPNRNFNDVYVDYIKGKLNNPGFDSTRLSKWIQGNRADPLKNPVYIDSMIQFIRATFQTRNIDPEAIATRIRTEYKNNTDTFYNFVKRHEKPYLKKEYVEYLDVLIRDENSAYAEAINPERTSTTITDPVHTAKPFVGYFSRMTIARIIVLSVSMAVIASLIAFTVAKAAQRPAPRIQNGTGQEDAHGIPKPLNIALFEKLPKEGQLILPKGFYFEVKTNMHGNARAFNPQDTLANIVDFSSAVARDRARLLKRSLNDFPTVIWENSDDRHGEDILSLKDYPENNTIEGIEKPRVLHNDEQIIMFEYSIDTGTKQ
jgi:hypothetical protein